MKNSNNFSISKTTKNKPKGLFFDMKNPLSEQIKNHVLGKSYELSLVFVGSKKSQSLNKEYRGYNKPTDILSFPFSDTAGEIFICEEKARRNAQKFNMKPERFIIYLFIHGLLHLKGFDHSDTMEKAEEKVLSKFKI